MGLIDTRPQDDGVRACLLQSARALVLRGDGKFSIAALCAEAGVERTAFRKCFSGKTALMAALMHDSDAARAARVVPEPPAAQAAPVPASDVWLERRLRVFERALNALEARAETAAREQARAIAQLEEKLAGMGASSMARAPVCASPVETAVVPVTPESEPEPAAEIAPDPRMLEIAPPPSAALSSAEMADVLQNARSKTRVVADPAPPKSNLRVRWLAIGALALTVLFVCVGMTLGDPARARQASSGSGVTHRHVAADAIGRTIARADAGDPRAQAGLALAYLRGDGVASDATAAARWSAHAARAGDPVALYLLGAMYGQGDGVRADPARALGYFRAAAERGNLKAMHNLAIAYAEGLGTPKDEAKAATWFARAAERGYVDSAFDLAVLYERGLGVKQDLKLALQWYAIAAEAGDEPSRTRAQFLRGQMPPGQARLANDAALEFTVLSPLAQANRLPEF